MSFLKRLFGNKEKPIEKDFTDAEHEKDYELKSKGLEDVLGEMHDLVGHAIIPFAIGGAVDMYYFPNHIKGTGFATMELLDPDGNGPLKNRLGTYELVAFTKYDYNASKDPQTPFNLVERNACGFLTSIGMYSSQAVLNPKETIEIPNGEDEENTCLVFDLYEPNGKKFKIGDREHHLLLCLQLFRSEMDYARQNGSDELFKLLKEKGHYPYSDLDREAVI
ncbi:suppressor of fused domain protein [Aquimarina megaterium]|uniref:suppressor of fused domain protein n=1 Tax=Aquimarina megaterium TaxID=1443666 RepID=UPI000942749D|nr:suppressor of fused domain protein [Aquimarina megaterium]